MVRQKSGNPTQTCAYKGVEHPLLDLLYQILFKYIHEILII